MTKKKFAAGTCVKCGKDCEYLTLRDECCECSGISRCHYCERCEEEHMIDKENCEEEDDD